MVQFAGLRSSRAQVLNLVKFSAYLMTIMDKYPTALAPEFEPSGAVKTPFDEWWARGSIIIS
ncbi:hypothetical protein BEL01nite_81230 [Bradyrhizobium elkanii]|nr:hypothetical protein BEL01nite_81230 [Bradyrhizobium elkanii]